MSPSPIDDLARLRALPDVELHYLVGFLAGLLEAQGSIDLEWWTRAVQSTVDHAYRIGAGPN